MGAITYLPLVALSALWADRATERPAPAPQGAGRTLVHAGVDKAQMRVRARRMRRAPARIAAPRGRSYMCGAGPGRTRPGPRPPHMQKNKSIAWLKALLFKRCMYCRDL
jgi:hypothetical protein